MDVPSTLIPVTMKGAVLLSTEWEFVAAVKQGKWGKRRAAVTVQTLRASRGAPTLAR
jgi:hypothetical protein